MGRRSTKENKNIYQTSREEAGYTREGAAEILEFISADRATITAHMNVLSVRNMYRKSNLRNYPRLH